MLSHRVCVGCKLEKPREAFARPWKSQRQRNPRGLYCGECIKQRHNEITREAAQRKRRLLKKECIEAYGGKCVCCGEKQLEFLTIDHTGGNGSEHRKAISPNFRGTNFYLWLKRNGWPKKDYRLLCYNCNCAIGHYGRCPHAPLLIASDVIEKKVRPGTKRFAY